MSGDYDLRMGMPFFKNPVEFKNRGITVDAVVWTGMSFLAIERGNEPFKGCWALPGGYVGWHETVEEACARELKEETGLDAVDLQLIGVYSNPLRDPKENISIAYLVRVSFFDDLRAGDDASRVEWIPYNEGRPSLAFDHNTILRDAYYKAARVSSNGMR